MPLFEDTLRGLLGEALGEPVCFGAAVTDIGRAAGGLSPRRQRHRGEGVSRRYRPTHLRKVCTTVASGRSARRTERSDRDITKSEARERAPRNAAIRTRSRLCRPSLKTQEQQRDAVAMRHVIDHLEHIQRLTRGRDSERIDTTLVAELSSLLHARRVTLWQVVPGDDGERLWMRVWAERDMAVPQSALLLAVLVHGPTLASEPVTV